jgi:peptidoglycan biosynthesis protein MviN/MurJ (putative lipid II flippase)
VTAQSLVALFTRAFYAAGNNRLPLLINALSALLIILFSYALTWLYGISSTFQFFIEDMLRVGGLPGTSVLVLPLAYSVGMILNAAFLLLYLEKHLRGIWTGIRRAAIQSFSVSVIMGFAAYHTLQFSNILFNQTRVVGVLLHGGVALIVAVIIGIFFFAILRNREYQETTDAIKHKFWKKKPIMVEQETVVG